jgi:hypothetical protein
MPTCKNDSSKTYKGTEPSPKGLGYCAHSEKEGKNMKGKDGNKWTVKKISNGSQRWVKKGTSKNNNQIVPNFNKFRVYNKSKNGFTRKIMGLQSKDDGYMHKWISYNKFEDKPSKIPTGYSLSNLKINKEWVNNYYCGKIPIQKSIVPKIKHTGYKKYMIHDNGGRPFLIYINHTNIFIYKVDENYMLDEEYDPTHGLHNSWMYTKLVKEYKNVKKVYIGKSVLNKITKFSGGHGHQFDGNSFLVHLSNNKYLFIGAYIKEFTLDDEVVKYYSTVGNNDVPYPIILGKKNVYFMLAFKYVDRKLLPDITNDIDWFDCYSHFYSHVHVEHYAKHIKNIKLIHKRV